MVITFEVVLMIGSFPSSSSFLMVWVRERAAFLDVLPKIFLATATVLFNLDPKPLETLKKTSETKATGSEIIDGVTGGITGDVGSSTGGVVGSFVGGAVGSSTEGVTGGTEGGITGGFGGVTGGIVGGVVGGIVGGVTGGVDGGT
jgi:hypothetical protein